MLGSKAVEGPADEGGEGAVHHGFEAGGVQSVEAVDRTDDGHDLDDLDLLVDITRGSDFNAPLPMTFDTPSLSESMLGNAINTVSKNTFGISEITPGSVAEESQYSGELHWKNTDDLVKESAVTNKVSTADESIAVESEGTSDTSSN